MKPNARMMNVASLELALAMILAWQSLEAADKDFTQHPRYICSIKVPEPAPEDLSSLAKIKAGSALAAALAANPGTTATKVELENENGCLIYSVQLNNGLDVKVDAGKGTVLYSGLAKTNDRDEEHEGREAEE